MWRVLKNIEQILMGLEIYIWHDLHIDIRKKASKNSIFFPNLVIIKTNLLNPAFLITLFFDIIFIA